MLEDPFCHLADRPRAPKHARAEGAVRRASTNTAGVPLKSAVRRSSLGVSHTLPKLDTVRFVCFLTEAVENP